jgi:hypothetical protein
MSIQPGVGYTFTSSSLGTNLNIEQPWSEWDPSGARIVQQFQVGIKKVGAANKLQLAKGTVFFTQSNMPRIKLGAHNDQRQSWISKVAVYGSGITRTAGTAGASDVWMESGGHYNITSAGTYYITISKFDINQSNDDTESALLNAEQPWVSIFKASDSIENTIFSETGPSEYVNKTNMHKMTGYDATSTGLSGDWGNCHTTWFNPVKWGYAVKLIATVTATAAPGEGGFNFTIDQHIVGPIDLQIPVQFIGTTLCNQDDLTETNDPYNQNKDSDPAWSFIVNADTLTNLNTLTPANEDWFQEFVGPADWTSTNYIGLTAGSCAAQDDDACLHPFQMKPRELTVASPEGPVILYRANICAGTVNNLIPWNRPGPSKVKLPTSIDFGYGGPGVSECKVFLRVGTQGHDTDNPIFPVTDDSSELYPTIVQYYEDQYPDIPADDDIFCYILMGVARNIGDPENFTIDQTISGSVWAERLKIGTDTARYYWAGV